MVENSRVKIIHMEVEGKCENCLFAYHGQFCLKCKGTVEWKDIPVTINDTPTRVDRPHLIPDWCPLPNKNE